MDKEKEGQSYNEFITELAKKYADQLDNEVFLKPTMMYSSITIPGLEKMRFPKLKKLPWYKIWRNRVLDAWAVLSGKKEALTQAEIDGLSDY